MDVRVIDYAPPWFRAKVLEGEVLLERLPGMVSIMRFIVEQIQRDFEVMIRIVLRKMTRGEHVNSLEVCEYHFQATVRIQIHGIDSPHGKARYLDRRCCGPL